MQNIHFKVAANNSFRRFSLPEVTLASLKTQVASIFGINDLNGWFIKYKDEENQMVTITSDEELFFAIQLHGGKVLHLEITFPGAEKQGKREGHKARLAVRLNRKQERMRERLASLNPENPRTKALASKIEAEISSISMELESLKHTDRKFEVKCNKVSCLVRKQEHIREKLAKIGEETENPRKLAKIAKLKEKLAVITSKLEALEKEKASTATLSPLPLDLKGEMAKPADQSSGIPNSENPEANTQLVKDVKSTFFVMKRELHQEKMHVISLVKTLKALRILSRHGGSAGISFDVDQLAKTEVSLGIARDQLAAKKLVIQQQKDLLALMKSQLGHRKDKRGKKDKKEKKDRKWEKKEEKVRRGRISKSENWKLEKKLRCEKRQGKHCRGRRNRHAEEDVEMSGNTSSDVSDENLEC